jgi:hypothetical protein
MSPGHERPVGQAGDIQALVLMTNTKAIDAYMTPMALTSFVLGQPSAVRLP